MQYFNFHTTLIVVHICAVRFTAKLHWVALFRTSSTQTTRYIGSFHSPIVILTYLFVHNISFMYIYKV